MTKPTVPAINASPLREQARDWFVRRHGGMDAAAEAAFQLWLAADAAHPQAYAQWETTSAEVGRMPEEVRALLRQPEMVVGTWRAARATAPDVTEQEVLLALERIEPLWDELFPAERARIVRLLVDRVDVRAEGAAVRLRLDGLGSLVRDLAAQTPEAGRAAA